MTDNSLKSILEDWESWSKTADKSEDGWEAGFPKWELVMSTAEALMERRGLSEEDLQLVEKCWKFSEEDENLADHAKANLATCWTNVSRLFSSRFSQVRWQVYEVLGHAGNRGEHLLREALKDGDAYCRRRAILSLAKLRVPDAKEIGQRFVNDVDPYIRQAAKELIDGA